MASKQIAWEADPSQSINVDFTGNRNGKATFSSPVNESIDREQTITFKTTDGSNKTVTRVIRQMGKREIFNCTDGPFMVAEGTFNVLKPEFAAASNTPIVLLNADGDVLQNP